MRVNKWNYDSCYELAKCCSKRSDMKRMNDRAYITALKNGWFSDYTWFLSPDEVRHMKRPSRVKWTYEKCREIALQYTTIKAFGKAYPSVYTVSRRHGWMDDFDWLERGCNIYTSKMDNVYAYFFNDFNSVYVGRTVNPSVRDMCHNTSESSTVFRFACSNNTTVPEMTILESGLTIMEGLYKEDYYCKKYRDEGWNVLNKSKTGIGSGSVGGLGSGKWNYKSCYKEAKKYNTLKEFRKKSPSSYNVVRKNGWLDDYVWLKKNRNNYWTYERCYNEAKLYSTRTQFQKGSSSAYDKSIKKKWIDDYFWFAPSQTTLKWNYENCYNEAKKYTKLTDFVKNCGRAYNVSRKNGWVKEFTWLETKDISMKSVLQFSIDGKLIAKYSGVREACRINGFKSNSGISQCCNGKLKTHKGFCWKYEKDYIYDKNKAA